MVTILDEDILVTGTVLEASRLKNTASGNPRFSLVVRIDKVKKGNAYLVEGQMVTLKTKPNAHLNYQGVEQINKTWEMRLTGFCGDYQLNRISHVE